MTQRVDHFLVDTRLKFWNSFFSVVLDWAPKLKQIYVNQKLDEI